MKICPHCQLQNYDNAQVCPRCNYPFWQFEQQRQSQPPQQQQQFSQNSQPEQNNRTIAVFKNPIVIGLVVFSAITTVLFVLSITGVIGSKGYAKISDFPKKEQEDYCGQLLVSSMFGGVTASGFPSETATPLPTITFSVGEKVVIGDSAITINRAELSPGHTDGTFLYAYSTFENNSSDTTYFNGEIGSQAFQNGVEAKVYNVDNSNLNTDLRPGSSIEVIIGVLLTNETSPVEIEFYDYNAFAPEKYLCTLDVGAL